METTILLLISEPLVRLVIQEVLEQGGIPGDGDRRPGNRRGSHQRSRRRPADYLALRRNHYGHQAAKYLQSRCPSMRILMVAGLLADDRLQYRAELDKVEIFPQPFTGPQLLRRCEEVLSRAGGTIEV